MGSEMCIRERYMQVTFTKTNSPKIGEGGGGYPALDRPVTSKNTFPITLVFVKVYCLMFHRKHRLTSAGVAEQYHWVLYWSRACCERRVQKSDLGRRTVCGVKIRSNNSRVAGGSRRCAEYTPRRYTIYDGQQSVGY